MNHSSSQALIATIRAWMNSQTTLMLQILNPDYCFTKRYYSDLMATARADTDAKKADQRARKEENNAARKRAKKEGVKGKQVEKDITREQD